MVSKDVVSVVFAQPPFVVSSITASLAILTSDGAFSQDEGKQRGTQKGGDCHLYSSKSNEPVEIPEQRSSAKNSP